VQDSLLISRTAEDVIRSFANSHPHPSASRQVQHSSRISQAAEDAIRSFDKEPTPVSKLQVQESLLIRL